ncbi:MAG: ribosome assembly factor SBDS [Nanoarchaeota archaeon]|nr:ribosome assembly factor SBDS [Nanoarchaeota archaeon]
MTQTTARITRNGKHYEIIVNMENALKFRKGANVTANEFLEIDKVFNNAKSGMVASHTEVENAFGTSDIYQVAAEIVKKGEVLTTQDYRDEEREKRVKQVVDFLAKNAMDPQTGRPHTPERIKNALEQAHVNIKNMPVESQIKDIVEQLAKIMPIKISTKKVKIVIPAVHTGKAYGLMSEYKEEENWLGNGDLEVIVVVPAGSIIDFYDKLNSMTHGSALTEEIKD